MHITYKKNIGTQWSTYTPHQKANIRKTLTEYNMVFSIAIPPCEESTFTISNSTLVYRLDSFILIRLSTPNTPFEVFKGKRIYE